MANEGYNNGSMGCYKATQHAICHECCILKYTVYAMKYPYIILLTLFYMFMVLQLLIYLFIKYTHTDPISYCEISNIRLNKPQNWNVSCLVLNLPLPNPFLSGVKWRMKMYLEQCSKNIWPLPWASVMAVPMYTARPLVDPVYTGIPLGHPVNTIKVHRNTTGKTILQPTLEHHWSNWASRHTYRHI